MSTIAMSGDSRMTAWTSVAVAHGRDDVESVVLEQAREAVAQERQVLGDHDAHGSSARTVVGPPPGLVTRSEPSSASTSPAEAGQAGAGRIGAAAAVDDLGHEHVADTVDANPDALRACVPRRVRERLGDGEVRRRLDGRRRPVRDVHRQRDRRPGCARRARSAPPRAPGRRGSAGGCRARGHAQLLERLRRAGPRLGEQHADGFGFVSSCCSASPSAHPERDEPSLRAVVQVALDPPVRLLDVDRAGAPGLGAPSIRWWFSA